MFRTKFVILIGGLLLVFSTFFAAKAFAWSTATERGWTCFPAGTKILMADKTEKNIEDIVIGDKVMGYDGKEMKSETVFELESPIRDHLYTLTFVDGSHLKLTSEHPLFTNTGWKSINPKKTYEEIPTLHVEQLKVGDKVFNKKGTYTQILKMEYVKGSIQTYNLKRVSQYSNFFADSYLAHNKQSTVTQTDAGTGSKANLAPGYSCPARGCGSQGGGDDSSNSGGGAPIAPVCYPVRMSCPNTCGQVARCASDGCGGQTCCPATGVCPTPTPSASATGGTITYSGQYIIHTFTQNGTFTPNRALNVEYLVVGGGGAGGGYNGGGGGAGGFRTGSNYAVIANFPVVVTIGTGGVGGSSSSGANGANTVFGNIVAAGGGGGGTYGHGTSQDESSFPGNSGGSGGGGTSKKLNIAGGLGNVPATNPSQGNNGGSGGYNFQASDILSYRPNGGGGGAGAVGGNGYVVGNVFRGGDGGVGRESSLSGVSKMYAGGGGGGIQSGSGAPGAGGVGGGGAGGDDTHPGVAGIASTGGGGGGSSSYGGAGGSGIVIIRYIPPSACLKRPQGDANCDDLIDAKDFDMFKSLLLENGKNVFADVNSKYSADFNNDKKVNLVDYEIWRNTFYH
jgi:hypothetical protein